MSNETMPTPLEEAVLLLLEYWLPEKRTAKDLLAADERAAKYDVLYPQRIQRREENTNAK